MATIDDLRRRFRAPRSEREAVEDEARTVGQKETSIHKINADYKISTDGKDALLKFGRHRGKRLVELLKSTPDYLEWMLKNDFPEDLKDVIRFLIRSKGISGKHLPAPIVDEMLAFEDPKRATSLVTIIGDGEVIRPDTSRPLFWCLKCRRAVSRYYFDRSIETSEIVATAECHKEKTSIVVTRGMLKEGVRIEVFGGKKHVED